MCLVARTIPNRSSALRSVTAHLPRATPASFGKSGKVLRAQDGGFLWYGLCRGADLTMIAGARPFPIPLDWVRYFLLQDPKWQLTNLTTAEFERLFQQSVEEYGAVFATDNPDLSQFSNHGGKIIMTHGQADQLIMTQGTVDYYQRVLRQMGGAKR